MNPISLLSKFKPTTYSLLVKPEWIIYSYDSLELPLLEQIVQEPEPDHIVINLVRFNGIRPIEEESVNEFHTPFVEASKAFFGLLQEIQQQTGLTRTEIQLRISQDLKEVENELKIKAADDLKNNGTTYAEIQLELHKIRQASKEESQKIAEILAPFTAQYNETLQNYNKTYDDYYVALIALFLSGKRLEATNNQVTFTSENVRRLHYDFRNELARFIYNEVNGWSDTEGKN
jgi:hypothetical protein